jgi:hypothetical protein
MNVECRRNVFCLFYKKMTERSETTLRHSIFDILRFAFNFVKFHTRGSGLSHFNIVRFFCSHAFSLRESERVVQI